MSTILFKVVNNNVALGTAQVVLCEDTLYITNVFVHPEFRRRGIATSLLQFVFMFFRGKCTWVELDDCTDLACRPSSIYVKLGFQYKDEHGPEMKARLNYLILSLKKRN